MKNTQILWIDRGKKRIWLAKLINQTSMPLPVGNISNDADLYYNLWDIIARNEIWTIVIWWPRNETWIQSQIDIFLWKLQRLLLNPDIDYHKVNEDYSSVESQNTLQDFGRNAWTDTLSAMVILERRQKIQTW
jgi:RNase H-fold protein (predicted Holliday junction resolvase)